MEQTPTPDMPRAPDARRARDAPRARRSWLASGLARILGAVLVGYAALVLLAQRAVTFPGQFRPAPSDGVPDGARRVWLETSAGRVESWLYRAEPRGGAGPREGVPEPPAVVFFHGNGELIDDWAEALRHVAAAGVTVLAVEFPGYGRSEGRPRRATIREAAAAAFDRLSEEPGVPSDRIVAWGRSMGGGAAADLALDRPVAALVLQSTFSSAMAMAATLLVPGFLVRDRFDPRRAVQRYAGPVLLMHGPTDEVIPYAHALDVAGARPGLEVIDLPCGHNDCAGAWPEIVQRVVDFLEGEGLLP